MNVDRTILDGIPIISNPHLPPDTAYLVNLGSLHMVVGKATRKLRFLHFILGRRPATGFDQMVESLR